MCWSSGLGCLPVTQEDTGSNPVHTANGDVIPKCERKAEHGSVVDKSDLGIGRMSVGSSSLPISAKMVLQHIGVCTPLSAG